MAQGIDNTTKIKEQGFYLSVSSCAEYVRFSNDDTGSSIELRGGDFYPSEAKALRDWLTSQLEQGL